MADSLAMSKEKNQPAIVFGKVIKNLRLERGLTQNNPVSYTHLDVYKRQPCGNTTAIVPSSAN